MKHFYKLLFVLFLFPSYSFAQSNYKPGYVVALSGDTIKGLINYREWNYNPEKFEFKKNASAQKEVYTIDNAVAFGVTGYEKYQRENVLVSRDKIDIASASNYVDTTHTNETVFLKQLNTGNTVIIYSYSDALKSRFYVSEHGEQPYELSYHPHTDPANQSNIIGGNVFKNQLLRLAALYQPKDKKLAYKIQQAQYQYGYLADIGNELNGVAANASAENNIRFFAGVGINSSSTKFKGEIDLAGAGSHASILPLLNVGTDIYFNKSIGTFIFRTTLALTGDKVNFSYKYTDAGGATYDDTFKFSELTATLTPQIVYNAYNTATLKVYLSAGIGINYHISSTKQYTVATSYVFGKVNTSDGLYPKLNEFTFTTPVKVGVIVKNRFDIYAGYIPNTTLNDDAAYSMRISAFQVGVNYLFGK